MVWVAPNLDELWIKNITLNTGLVNANTTEMLLNVLKSGKIDATKLITHHFKLSEVEKAYDVFKHAGENNALKVIIENDISEWCARYSLFIVFLEGPEIFWSYFQSQIADDSLQKKFLVL